jgi:hypothetical protein
MHQPSAQWHASIWRVPGLATRHLIPQPDGAPVGMMRVDTQQAHRPFVQREVLAFKNIQADPACGQRGAELAMRKQHHSCLHRAQTRDESVGSRTDVGGRAATRAAVAPDVPVWLLAPNVDRALAFVFAVIQLGQIGLVLARRPQASELAGLACAQARAHQHLREDQASQPWCRARDSFSPYAVRLRSFTPVCWPVSVQAVSPGRTRPARPAIMRCFLLFPSHRCTRLAPRRHCSGRGAARRSGRRGGCHPCRPRGSRQAAEAPARTRS